MGLDSHTRELIMFLVCNALLTRRKYVWRVYAGIRGMKIMVRVIPMLTNINNRKTYRILLVFFSV